MAPDQDPAATYALKRLRRPNAAGLESAGGSSPDLSDDRIKTSLEIACERFRRIAKRTTKTGKLTAAQKQVLTDADAALRALAHEGDNAKISDRQMVARPVPEAAQHPQAKADEARTSDWRLRALGSRVHAEHGAHAYACCSAEARSSGFRAEERSTPGPDEVAPHLALSR